MAYIRLMQKQGLWRYMLLGLMVTSIIFGGSRSVMAEPLYNSENYQLIETEFGGGSSLESCSDAYCARVTIGDVTDANQSRNEHTATFGPISSTDPLLEVIIEPGQSNLGVLNTQNTATKTMIVKIRNYLSGGYVLQIVGDPPKYNNHTLNTPTTLTGSAPGTEQFAINAVANTLPNVGADPVQVPSGETSFGEVDEDYNFSNLFKYSSGDIVARSLTESGRTDYTISMIINIADSTPAGNYTADFAAIVVPVY